MNISRATSCGVDPAKPVGPAPVRAAIEVAACGASTFTPAGRLPSSTGRSATSVNPYSNTFSRTIAAPILVDQYGSE